MKYFYFPEKGGVAVMCDSYCLTPAYLVKLEAAATDGVLFDDDDDAGERGGQLPHRPGHVLRVNLQTLLAPGRTLDDPDQPSKV